MTSFEKFQASTEARRTSRGDHVDKLTGYFMAEANRLREQEEPVADVAPEPASEPPPPQAKKYFRWLRWWKRN